MVSLIAFETKETKMVPKALSGGAQILNSAMRTQKLSFWLNIQPMRADRQGREVEHVPTVKQRL